MFGYGNNEGSRRESYSRLDTNEIADFARSDNTSSSLSPSSDAANLMCSNSSNTSVPRAAKARPIDAATALPLELPFGFESG